MIHVFYTTEGYIFPIAQKMKEGGHKIHVVQIQGREELENNEKKEKENDKEKRLRIYEGILKVEKAKEITEKLIKVKSKDNYAIWFDMNNIWKYSEILLKAGFKIGNFATKEDYSFEIDRGKAKKFVEENYPDIKVGEFHDFKTIEEGIAFLEGSQDIWVLKSYGTEGSTIVPNTNDVEHVKNQIIKILKNPKNKKDYEEKGYLFEKKILNATEFTPEMIWWNGKPVYSNIDIETKNLGAGENNGVQVGCATNLIIKTEIESEINKIAFPEAIHRMALTRPGLFIWDISILMDNETGEFYFGEFCPNRFGWDAFIAELAMSKTTGDWFDSIVKGEDSLEYGFGFSVRLFNIPEGGGKITEDSLVQFKKEAEPDVWLFDVRKDEEGDVVTNGSFWDLGVVTGFGESPEEAIEMGYKYADMVSFEGLQKRPKFDALSEDYTTAIMTRYNNIKKFLNK